MVLLFCPACATSLLLANLPGFAAAATAAVATKEAAKALHLLPQRREERVAVADVRKPLPRLEAKTRRQGGQ